MNKNIPFRLSCEYETNPLGIQRRHPLLGWQIRSEEVNGYQTAYQIVAASTMERLETGDYDLWNSGRVEERRNRGISYAGAELHSAQRVFWKVRIWNQCEEVSEYSQTAWFEMGLLQQEDWKGNWMSFLGGLIGNGILMRYYFETSGKTVLRARAYVCCAGYYEFHMNGGKVGTKILDPAPTDYSKTLLYSTYDITENIRKGGNVVGFVLGTGWAGLPKVLLQLNIEYEDGTIQEEFTDWGIGWCVARGPIVYNSLYDGEDYDARLEKDGWDTPEYQPTFLKEHQRPDGWILATVVEDPGGEKIGEILPPIRICRKKKAAFLKKMEDGRLLYDAGENQSGWVRIVVSGETGAKVTLSFAEILDENGNLDKTALRLARCEDRYILRGDREYEEYVPRFTYHGFRYFTAELEGDVELKEVMVEFVHSDLKDNAIFDSDNTMLNQLARVMKHTDACNLMGIPSDCAQRDERLGWTTDTTSRAESCTYHFDMASFFEKWARDVYDTQNRQGYFADTAPFRWGRRPCDPQVNTPVSLVLLLYQMYGNKRLIEDTYDSMMRYLQVLLKEADHYLISRTGFGEWACPKEYCYPEEYGAGAVPKHVTATLVSTAYLYRSVSQMKEMADILENGDSAYLEALGETIRDKFNEKFYHSDTAQYDQGSQSANALAIDLGLAREENILSIVDHIAEDIKKHDYCLSTGNMGTKAVIEVLCRYGYEDMAYEVMINTKSPSFGYMLEQGATTMWERWEADRDNNIMNSRNHPMLSAASVWFYKYLGGIQIRYDKQGCQTLMIEPVIPQKMKWVKTEMDISNGHVSSFWEKVDGRITFHAEIPFNTKTEIVIQKKYGKVAAIIQNGKEITVSGKEINDRNVYTIGSGKYCFIMK